MMMINILTHHSWRTFQDRPSDDFVRSSSHGRHVTLDDQRRPPSSSCDAMVRMPEDKRPSPHLPSTASWGKKITKSVFGMWLRFAMFSFFQGGLDSLFSICMYIFFYCTSLGTIKSPAFKIHPKNPGLCWAGQINGRWISSTCFSSLSLQCLLQGACQPMWRTRAKLNRTRMIVCLHPGSNSIGIVRVVHLCQFGQQFRNLRRLRLFSLKAHRSKMLKMWTSYHHAQFCGIGLGFGCGPSLSLLPAQNFRRSPTSLILSKDHLGESGHAPNQHRRRLCKPLTQWSLEEGDSWNLRVEWEPFDKGRHPNTPFFCRCLITSRMLKGYWTTMNEDHHQEFQRGEHQVRPSKALTELP